MSLENKIKSLAKEVGFDLIGISKLDKSQYKREVEGWLKKQRHGEMKWYERNLDRRLAPNMHLYNRAVTAVTVGLYYRPAEIPPELKVDPSRGLIARYARYDDYHKIMEVMLDKLAERISQLVKDWNFIAYVDTGPVLEREVGAKGGLGFIGKNTTLISPTLGSYFFLGEIICDLDLTSDQRQAAPVIKTGQAREEWPTTSDEGEVKTIGTCGLCQRCLKACPTKAIISAYQLDARRCISYLTIENKGAIPLAFRPLLGNWIYGCDICQEVCPWNKRLPESLLSRLQPRGELIAPKLLDLVDLSEDEFKKYFAATPIRRARRQGFIRNVLVAIGNWADKKAWSAVSKLVKDESELVSEHARWAKQQILLKN